MSTLSSVFCLLSTCFMLFVLTENSQAFVRQTFETGLGRNVNFFWSNAEAGVPYSINSRGSDDIGDEGEFEAIRRSFKTWQDVPTAFISFRDQGLTERFVSSNDGVNLILFDETGSIIGSPRGSGVIAITRTNSASFSSGALRDADIIFNGRDFTFTTDGVGGIDIEDTATHEIGHFLGLDHTGLIGSPQFTPTMNPFSSATGQTFGRTLEPDDIAGVSSIYPTSQFLSSTGTISGRVTQFDGSPIFGANVVALNPLTGRFVVSTLSGAISGRRGSGEYIIFGLSPGQYLVSISPVDGPITDANFGGIFQNFDTDFEREFFDNVPNSQDALPVTVEAGGEIGNINFVTGFTLPGLPLISGVSILSNVTRILDSDQVGATVTVSIRDDEGIQSASLFFTTGEDDFDEIPLLRSNDHIFGGQIPPQIAGTQIRYYILAEDTDGNISTLPPQAPELTFQYRIFPLTGEPLAYIAVRRSNLVSIIDTGSYNHVARIPVGDNPIGIAITPNDSLVYISNSQSDNISVIETATNRVRTTIPVGGSPLDLASTSDSRFVYVNNSDSNSISVIDTRTDRVSHTKTNVMGPFGIAISPDDARLYVTNINFNTLTVIDTRSNTIIGQIAVVPSPRSVAVTPDGEKAYVTSFTGDGISVIDTETNTVITTIDITPAQSSFGVAISPNDGKAYVTDYQGGNIVVIDTQQDIVEKTIPTGGTNTRGVAVTPDGTAVYVSNQDSDNIVILGTGQDEIVTTLEIGEGPRGIAIRKNPIGTDVAEENKTASRPRDFSLEQNYPNPFNPRTTITYGLPVRTHVRLAVYNAIGQKVRTLMDQEQISGVHTVAWDGLDDGGGQLASGIYFYRLKTQDGFTASKKAVLIR